MSGVFRLAAGSRHRRRAGISVLFGTVAIGASIGLLATSGYLISKAALRPDILTLTVAIVGVRFFGIVRALFRYLERLASHDVAFRILAEIRTRLFDRLVPLAPSGLKDFRSGDLLSRFVGDVDSLQNVFLRAVAPPLVAVAAIALAVGIAAWFLPVAAIVLLAGLVVAATVVPAVGWLGARSVRRRRSPAQADVTAELLELLAGTPELAVYGRADAYRERVRAADRSLTGLAKRDALVSGLTSGLGTLTAAATAVAVLAVGIPAVGAGSINGVLLAVLVFLTLAAFESVTPLPLAAAALSSAGVGTRRIDEITSAEAIVREAQTPRPCPTLESLTIRDGRFRYGDDGPWVLDGIDLHLEPGRRVALIGPSGSGKSTVARLLVRFCDLDAGRILLNGHDIREFAHADVRRRIALGAQDAHVFATTIRENVRLADPTASDDEIIRALGQAGAWRWVSSLEHGLETFVGEDGTLLSGGQRQRVTLARMLLSDAQIVILDEPTAHLDPAAAAAFVNEVVAATSERGLLMITHRLARLELFDEIVVMEAGRVVERGTAAELRERDGRYAALLRDELQ